MVFIFFQIMLWEIGRDGGRMSEESEHFVLVEIECKKWMTSKYVLKLYRLLASKTKNKRHREDKLFKIFNLNNIKTM